jgi:hypothetical protein
MKPVAENASNKPKIVSNDWTKRWTMDDLDLESLRISAQEDWYVSSPSVSYFWGYIKGRVGAVGQPARGRGIMEDEFYEMGVADGETSCSDDS